MQGWILYKRRFDELTDYDHGVNRLLAAAKDLNIDLKVFSYTQFNLISGNNHTKTILIDGKPAELPDFIVPRMGAESNFLTLSLIRQLELAGVYSANSANAIELVKDKMRFNQLLAANLMPTPKSMLLSLPFSIDLVEQYIGFPLVIKNIFSARGVGVHLCETANSFRDLIGLFPEKLIQQFMVQEFIASSYGRDLRVFVVGEEIVGCMQRTAKEGFKANYSLGGDVKSYKLNAEISKLALDCVKLTGLEIAGIDLLFTKDGHFTICEANSAPGFKGMEAAINEDISRKILEYISIHGSAEAATGARF